MPRARGTTRSAIRSSSATSAARTRSPTSRSRTARPRSSTRRPRRRSARTSSSTAASAASRRRTPFRSSLTDSPSASSRSSRWSSRSRPRNCSACHSKDQSDESSRNHESSRRHRGGRDRDPQGDQPRHSPGRSACAHGSERLGQEHARPRPVGAARLHGDAGRCAFPREGSPRNAGRDPRARRRLPRVSISGGDPRSLEHVFPPNRGEHRAEAPRSAGARRDRLPRAPRREGEARGDGRVPPQPLRQRGLLGRREEAQRGPPDGDPRPEARDSRRDRLGPRHRRDQDRRRGSRQAMTRPARATAIHEGIAALVERATELAERRPSPPWLQKLRSSGVAAFEKLGFPSTNDEEWRFTNLAPLARIGFALSPDEVSLAERTAALELEARLGPLGLSSPQPRIVFVNGRLLRRSPGGLTAAILFECMKNVLATSPERVERALVAGAVERDPSKQFFGSLGDAFLDEGVVLHVPVSVHLAEPLFILHVSTSPGSTVPPRMVHTRNLFTFEENSSATVVEAYLGANGPSFTNARTDVTLAKGARLHHVKLQLEGLETIHVGQLAVAHAAGAHAASHVFSFGGRLVRNEITMTLRGEDAGTELNGLFCAASGQHVDCHTLIDHALPRASSVELYKLSLIHI